MVWDISLYVNYNLPCFLWRPVHLLVVQILQMQTRDAFQSHNPEVFEHQPSRQTE